MYKIIGGDGNEYGPVSAEQLRGWAAEGRVNRATRVRAADSTDWKTLADFPELASAVVAAPPVAPAPAGKTSGMAITSLVLGVLGFGCWILTALPGLILGIVSLKKINHSGGQLTGRGIAIAGIAVSSAMMILGLSFVGIYAAMFLPALNAAREKARIANCQSNLRQVGLCIAMYADLNKEQCPSDNADPRLATAVGSFNLLTNVTSSAKIFVCPSDTQKSASITFGPGTGLAESNLSYTYVGAGLKWQDNPDAVIAYDNDGNHRNKGYNVLFADGHVEFMPPERFSQLRLRSPINK